MVTEKSCNLSEWRVDLPREFVPLVSVEILPDMGATSGRRGDGVEIPQTFLEPWE